MKKVVLQIYRMMLHMFDLLELVTVFGGTPVSRYFEALGRISKRVRHRNVSLLISSNGYGLRIVPCVI